MPRGKPAVFATDGAVGVTARAFRAFAVPTDRRMRWADLLVMALTLCAALLLAVHASWVPEARESMAVFAALALAVPVLRTLARTFPDFAPINVVATLWVLVVAGLAHPAMKPLVDALHPNLSDAYLARADLTLFGDYPAAFLDRHVRGVGMDALLVCYYTYYVWPSALGLLLFFRRRRQALEHFVLAVSVAYGINYVFYVLVPAIGPRFYLLDVFPGPLQGATLTTFLSGLMQRPTFMRDCFPSGHTGITLLVLVFAWRYARRFFWVMLPVGLGLITATMAGRFHYGIDVLCAIPMTLIAVLVSDLGVRLDADGRIPLRRAKRT